MLRDFERLSVERVKEVLYDDGSGILRWKIWMGCRAAIHSVAGCCHIVRREKRWTIQIDRGKYLRSRLVFVLNKGRWPLPDLLLDHEDKDTLNDCITNLREFTPKQNTENREPFRLMDLEYQEWLSKQ